MANKLRELLLLRHAKSDWSDDQHADIERPISEKGKKQARKIAKWITQQNLTPDLILISPAKRAQQTYRRICQECPSEAKTIASLYMAELEALKSILAGIQDVNRVMIIGHNPGLEQLLRFLTHNPLDDSTQLFPTASLAHFILPHDWQNLDAGDAKLQQFIRPKDIKLFP